MNPCRKCGNPTSFAHGFCPDCVTVVWERIVADGDVRTTDMPDVDPAHVPGRVSGTWDVESEPEQPEQMELFKEE